MVDLYLELDFVNPDPADCQPEHETNAHCEIIHPKSAQYSIFE